MWSTTIIDKNSEALKNLLLHFEWEWYTFQFETYPLTSKIQRNTAVLKGIKIMFCDGG